LPAGAAAAACLDGIPVQMERWEEVLLGPEAQLEAAAVATGGGAGDALKGALNVFRYIFPPAYVASFYLDTVMGWAFPSPHTNLPGNSGGRSGQRPLITGATNELRPFGKVPKLRGRRRVYPQLAALPYSEWQGRTQFYNLLFSFGKGPLHLQDLQIGNTPLSAFEDVQYQIRPGWPTDDPIEHYEDQVLEEGVHAQLRYETDDDPPVATAPSTRVTDAGVTKFGVDISFPTGLGQWNDKGEKKHLEVKFKVEYQDVSADPSVESAWKKVSWRDGGKEYSSPLVLKRDEPGDPFVYPIAFSPPEGEGQYRVRIHRISEDHPSAKKFSESWWTVLRSFRPGNPVLLEGVCTVSMRIKATGQLTGVLQNFSALATSIVPYWNEDTSAWVVPTASSSPPTEPWQYASPASHFRATLEARKTPIPTSRMDLATLEAWAEETRAKGLYFNHLQEDAATVFETLKLIATAGRASYSMRDGKHSVAMDRYQATPVQHFTPRNTFGFQGERAFAADLHALRVKYTDGEGAHPTWKLVEVTVFEDGYSVDGAGATDPATLYGDLTLEWCTSRDEAWKHGRYRLAARRLRRDLYHFSADVQHLVCNRGDLVILGSEMLDGTPVWGRVKSVALDGGGNATSVTVDEKLLVDGAKSYRFRFVLGTSTTPVDANVLNPGAGEKVTFTFDPAIPAASPKPVAGNLFLFGERTVEWRRAVVTSIEPETDFRARITCMDEAPGVFTADGSTIPGGGSGASAPAPRNDETDVGTKAKVQVLPKPAGTGSRLVAGIVVKITPSARSKNTNVSRVTP
ncbi:MAG: hypothetical protein HUU06_01365, partial [Planctomycetaceae bacterium]|nr:hypothetical protein [Planctomycetaceae bacterium]